MRISLLGGVLDPLLDWLITPDRVSGRAPIWRTVPFLVVTLGVGAYAVIATGKLTGANLFLALSAATLFEVGRLLYTSARSLFAEPPPLELAVATGRRRKELEREKTALLKALKELEFDHEMGKISDPDFEEIGGQYRARAIRVLRQLDDREVDYVRFVEEELARHKRGSRPGRSDAAPVVAAPAAVPTAAVTPILVPSPVVMGCAGCGTLNDPDAVFCKKCARRLASEAAAKETA